MTSKEGVLRLGQNRNSSKSKEKAELMKQLSPRRDSQPDTQSQTPLNRSIQKPPKSPQFCATSPASGTLRPFCSPFGLTITSNMKTQPIEDTPTPPTISIAPCTLTTKQGQLQQRVRVLEARVCELHRENNDNVLKLEAANRRLVQENARVRADLQAVAAARMRQILMLRQEIQALRVKNKPVQQQPTTAEAAKKVNQKNSQADSAASIQEHIGKEQKKKKATQPQQQKDSKQWKELQKIVEQYLTLDSKYKTLKQQMLEMKQKLDEQDKLISKARQQHRQSNPSRQKQSEKAQKQRQQQQQQRGNENVHEHSEKKDDHKCKELTKTIFRFNQCMPNALINTA